MWRLGTWSRFLCPRAVRLLEGAEANLLMAARRDLPTALSILVMM